MPFLTLRLLTLAPLLVYRLFPSSLLSTALLLLVLCLLFGWQMYRAGEEPGQRLASKNQGNPLGRGAIIVFALVVYIGWLVVTFGTLLLARALGLTLSFDLLLATLVVGGSPWFLLWFTYSFRNRSGRAYHLWQGFALLMLLGMSCTVCALLFQLCHLLAWQTGLMALPLLSVLWSLGIYEVREPPTAFRAMCPWQRSEGLRTRVYIPPDTPAHEVQAVVAGCDATLERVCTVLEVAPLPFMPEVFLCRGEAAHQRLLGHSGQRSWAYAHEDCISLIYSPWSACASTVAHELTHIVRIHQITPHLLPLLDEGLARYVQNRLALVKQVPTITLPTSLFVLAQPVVFYDFQYAEMTEYSAAEKYTHAHALVTYLLHWQGFDKFKLLCQEVSKTPKAHAGERLAKACQVVYGMGLADLEKQWRTEWGALARQWENRPDPVYAWERFTAEGRAALQSARDEAEALGHGTVATEHLLLGLLREEDCRACLLLTQMGVPLPNLSRMLRRDAERGLGLTEDKEFSDQSRRVLDLAFQAAREYNSPEIGTEHLLLGLVREEQGLAGRTLHRFGIKAEGLHQYLETQI